MQAHGEYAKPAVPCHIEQLRLTMTLYCGFASVTIQSGIQRRTDQRTVRAHIRVIYGSSADVCAAACWDIYRNRREGFMKSYDI